MANLDLYIVTFNCGRELVDPQHLASGFFHGLPKHRPSPDIVVLCLEEIAPIAYAYLGGLFLAPYFAHLHEAVQIASRDQQNYKHVLTRNLGMTGITILAKPDVASQLRWLETAGVGVGMSEMGNKGAVGVRLGLQRAESDTIDELTFVAAHLAPMEDALLRRNQDWKDIVRGLAFTRADGPKAQHKPAIMDRDEMQPLLSPSEAQRPEIRSMFYPGTLLFFAGDLNYRTSDTAPTPQDAQSYPQPAVNEDDPHHYSHLLHHDQLKREHTANRTLHGLEEAAIDFPPTYKYSPKQWERSPPPPSAPNAEPTSYYWSTHRWPSWPDRIFFSAALAPSTASSTSSSGASFPLQIHNYTALPLQRTSDHRPVALSCTIDLAASSATLSEHGTEAAPFPLNPNWQRQRAVARRKEIAVGLFAYFSTTWEGRGIVLAMLVGSAGGWFILRSLVGTQ